MSYIDPKIQDKFHTLSPALQDVILKKDVSIYTLQDLIKVLDEIVKENE